MDFIVFMICSHFLTSEDRLELERCVRRRREDHGIARRANATLLLDKGKSCAVIAEFLYLDDDTIRGWYKAYRQEGWEALAINGWQGSLATLNISLGILHLRRRGMNHLSVSKPILRFKTI